ncbi:S-layer homology domain-containing protein [Candidatus Peregrinibacteria bacterium]|jgi:hypothetical protein|nr:S-layer homology domain-containing protein [Candidatus Peregrinibacteria bacterium]MBT4147916.1 S-layer homology domain-containing protein [Candidatus Peregrinibacteria bacterium]MBT4456407.1 S-layer homology domain-containing protein [Candidatus Peregrinibacteria bacterium]
MKGLKSLVALVAVVAVFLVSTTAFASFTDVSSGHDNYDAIMYVQENDIVGGYSDGTFRPDDPINRAELLKILVIARNGGDISDSYASKCFSDVLPTDWYSKYVCYGSGEGYVDGYPNGTFDPTGYVTFSEAAKMIVVTMGYLVYPDVNTWYEPYVLKLEEKNTIPTSIHELNSEMTRGEVAEIIYRLDAEVTNKSSKSYAEMTEFMINADLEITSPVDGAVFYDQPFYVYGTTSSNCSSIKVIADNQMFDIHDVYTLQNYSYGDTTFKYGISHDWGNLDLGANEYTFTAYCSNATMQEIITLYYEDTSAAEMGKPVIYLYPERAMEVSVLPEPEYGVTISEPELGDGWEVVAYPNGSIVNLEDGSRWDYLFWEGYADLERPEEGFLVSHDGLEKFWDAKLSYLGLNRNEIADFKEFWLEQLSDEGYYVISFVDQAELDEHAPLTVAPAPDTSIRVYFDYEVYDKPVRVKEQVLEKGADRNGFTLVEWGGALY